MACMAHHVSSKTTSRGTMATGLEFLCGGTSSTSSMSAPSRPGTFAGILTELERLKRLGITAIEIMTSTTPPPGPWRLLINSADAKWEGPEASATERRDSAGDISVVLHPYSFQVYAVEQ